jgi:hypothetical protein
MWRFLRWWPSSPASSILVMPRMRNYIVAIYLIVMGVIVLFAGGFNLR